MWHSVAFLPPPFGEQEHAVALLFPLPTAGWAEGRVTAVHSHYPQFGRVPGSCPVIKKTEVCRYQRVSRANNSSIEWQKESCQWSGTQEGVLVSVSESGVFVGPEWRSVCLLVHERSGKNHNLIG